MEPPPGMALHGVTDELDDFADTAARVAALDLVIRVDTAVAHLAGTLDNRCGSSPGSMRTGAGRRGARTALISDRPAVSSAAPGDWHAAINEVAATPRDFARRG